MTFAALTVLVLLVMFGAPALVKAAAHLRRRSARARLGQTPLLREANRLGGRIQLHRTPPLHGMQAGRSYRLSVDLLLAPSRLIIASDRGLIADLAPHSEQLDRVVSPGPQRLLIEGRVPVSGKPTGRYRLELVVEDAAAWAEALLPFTTESSQ